MIAVDTLNRHETNFRLTDLAQNDNNILPCFGAVAQLGERKAGSLEVRGSIPLCSTSKIKGLRVKRSPFFFGLLQNCCIAVLRSGVQAPLPHQNQKGLAFPLNPFYFNLLNIKIASFACDTMSTGKERKHHESAIETRHPLPWTRLLYH